MFDEKTGFTLQIEVTTNEVAISIEAQDGKGYSDADIIATLLHATGKMIGELATDTIPKDVTDSFWQSISRRMVDIAVSTYVTKTAKEEWQKSQPKSESMSKLKLVRVDPNGG